MKLRYLCLSLLLMAGLSSCYDEYLEDVQVPKQEVEVSFKFSGEITSEDTPLTRAMTTDDLLGIQVYKEGEGYAYGLFDNIDDMKLKLETGSKYKFVVTIVKNGKNVINTKSWPIEYKKPFYDNNSTSNPHHGGKLDNSYLYSAAYFDKFFPPYIDLGNGLSELSDGNFYDYPETDRFYGEIDNWSISNYGENPAIVDMNMKRTAFGLKYEVTGLSDGTASITIKNDSRTFFENTSISDAYSSEAKVFTFSNVRDAWLYADDGYVENVTVSMKWTRSIGIEQDLGSKTVQIKRNALNNIRVSLSEGYGGSALKIDVEDAAMGNETVTIPVAP